MKLAHQLILEPATSDHSVDLAIEFDQAHEELIEYIAELEGVLRGPDLDTAALTAVRLKIAQLRLVRGTLLLRIRHCLADKLSVPEKQMVDQLHVNHYELLRHASEHTGKWSLQAIERKWDEYCVCAKKLADSWIEKMTWEQEILLPLLRRANEAKRF